MIKVDYSNHPNKPFARLFDLFQGDEPEQFINELKWQLQTGGENTVTLYWRAKAALYDGNLELSYQLTAQALEESGPDLQIEVLVFTYELNWLIHNDEACKACADFIVKNCKKEDLQFYRLWRIGCYNALNLPVQSINLGQELDGDSKSDNVIQYHRGVSLELLGDQDQALQLWQKCVEDQTWLNSAAYYALVNHFLDLGQIKRALDLVDKGLQRVGQGDANIWGSVGDLHKVKANALGRIGALEEATVESRLALQKNTEYLEEASTHFAHLLNRLGNYPEALEVLQKIGHAGFIQNPAYLREMGIALVHLQRFKESLGPLNLALSHNNKDLEIAELSHALSISHQQLGQQRESWFFAAQCLSLQHGNLLIVDFYRKFFKDHPWAYRYGFRQDYLTLKNPIGNSDQVEWHTKFQTKDSEDPKVQELKWLAILLRGSAKLPFDLTKQTREQAVLWLYVLSNQWNQVYEFIDQEIQPARSLYSSEEYLRIYAAYQIAEPRASLKAHILIENAILDDEFSEELNRTKGILLDAINQDRTFDGYVISANEAFDLNRWPENLNSDSRVEDVYLACRNGSEWEAWFSKNELLGMMGQWLVLDNDSNEVSPHMESKSWRSLNDVLQRQGKFHFHDILTDSRGSIRDGVSYMRVLKLLCSYVITTEDPLESRKLSMVMAGVFMSHHFDHLKKENTYRTNTEIVVGTLADMTAGEALRTILFSGLLVKFGIAWSIGYLISKPVTKWFIANRDKPKEDLFDNLLRDIESLDHDKPK